MKKILSCIVALLIFIVTYSQRNSWDGWSINPTSHFNCLNIFINIIYDISDPNNSNFPTSIAWRADTINEGINTCQPTYLLNYMDTIYNSNSLHGLVTRVYGESSFNNLQICGDFVVVNIKESTIIGPNNNQFNYNNIINAVVTYINNSGGLSTIYNHNNIQYYDYENNGKIFFTNILIRNITKEYGGINEGSGYGSTGIPSTTKILVDGVERNFNHGTRQCIGSGNISRNPKNIFVHEIAHSFFGSNAFHTSGGNHRGSSEPMPFLSIQGGYGLMGNSGSSLVSCNGYERWRMHWRHPSNSSVGSWIVARSKFNYAINSDIQKSDGNKSFWLRDFVTYGDAIRIKLPYKDSEDAYNQYIWIENHQGCSNGKLDSLQFANIHNCRPQDASGVYMYYQVGRDVLSGSYYDVYDAVGRDNLRMIPAEGYWNYTVHQLNPSDAYNFRCINWQLHDYYTSRDSANPFCGTHDMETHYSIPSNSNNITLAMARSMWRKTIGENNIDSLVANGDARDAFKTQRTINMGTNPSTCNTKAFYNNNNGSSSSSILVPSANCQNRNNLTTYLTGLGIEVIPLSNGTARINIRWDDYNIRNDAFWTGRIVLKEQAILNTGYKIILQQNLTPSQVTPDAISGYFAPTTSLICESGSNFVQQNASEVKLTEKSSLVLESGSRYEVGNGASLIVDSTASLVLNAGDSLIVKGGGYVLVKNCGNLIYNGGTIFLQDAASVLEIVGNLHIGDNATFTTSGNGYVKFSNTGTWDNTFNVISGVHSSICFRGTGKNDKKLEIEQSTVRFPQLDSLSFRNCKIEMGSEKRMQADYNYPITFSNVLLTSKTGTNNNHRSFNFFGQANTIINNCIFEYGTYGISGILTYNGNDLSVINSTFRYNNIGIWMYDKGVNFENCTCTNNSGYGIYCNAMSSTSFFDDCVCSDNGNGNYYMGSSTAGVYIDGGSFTNSTNGFAFSGSFDVDMVCAMARGNQNGIYTQNGTRIIPSSSSLNRNNIAINLNYGYISLLNGYNELQSIGDYYTINGYTPETGPILAHNNRWETNTSAQPAYTINYYLRRNISPFAQVNIYDYTPAYMWCKKSYDPNISDNYCQMPLDMDYDSIMSYDMENMTQYDCEYIVNKHIDYIIRNNNNIDYFDTYRCNNVYGHLFFLLSKIFSEIDYELVAESKERILNDVVQMNEYLSERVESEVHSYKYLLDAALLYRTADRHDIANWRIDNLINFINSHDFDSDEYLNFVVQWKCYIENEILLKIGELNADEFIERIQNCELQNSTKSIMDLYDDVQLENDSQIIELNISPNPVNSILHIEIPNENNSLYDISIMNNMGVTVKNFSSVVSFDFDVSELPSGLYFVKAIADDKNFVGRFFKN